MATESPVRNYSIKCNTWTLFFKNPALPREVAYGANIGDAEREKILIVVADDVVDAADFQAKAATVGVIANLILLNVTS